MEAGPWNKDRLMKLVKAELGDRLFILVSNREPYVHTRDGASITWDRPVGGLTEALDPVMRASGGTWVAQGTGSGDRESVDEYDRVMVPPDSPEYTLRRVWLTAEEVAGFYLGFANGVLWPLCHVTFTPPVFKESDWNTYQKVNHFFADAILQEIGNRQAIILLQDYHFALLSRCIKERSPQMTVGQFWHIPWPPYEVFRTCPWARELLNGMLGNDLLGFNTLAFCNDFTESVERSLEVSVNRRRSAIVQKRHTTIVEPFPLSVDFDGLSQQAGEAAVKREMETLRREYHLDKKILGVGMDRLDYIKGIPERLMALDRFFEMYPEYRGRVVFIQAGMPSRTEIDIYRETGLRIENLVITLNKKYGSAAWQPIILMEKQLTHDALSALRRLAHFCMVSSLHDGMNIVGKEYVSSRTDGDGVLILSRFTGAAAELTDALQVNPYAIGELAMKIREAIEMPEVERRRRMKNMRQVVSQNNIYRWGGDMVSRLISLAGNR
jgi:trehalose-6-phosphate synthase